jgi:hypothetical protein
MINASKASVYRGVILCRGTPTAVIPTEGGIHRGRGEGGGGRGYRE